MLIQSSLLVSAVIQVIIFASLPGSQTNAQTEPTDYGEFVYEQKEFRNPFPNESNTCPDTWDHVDSRCFKVINDHGALTWSAARVYCNHLGQTTGIPRSDLAVAKDNIAVGALHEYISSKYPAAYYWIGASNLYTSGGVSHWTWVDNGSNVTQYKDEPKLKGECLYINTKEAELHILQLGNEGCGESLLFVCEKF